MRVVFIVPHLAHPRFHRRAQAFLANGYNVTVYGFERGIYSQNHFPAGVEEVSLGNLSSGGYIRRIPKVAKAAAFIRQNEKSHSERPNLIFAFGLDCALIAIAIRTQATPFSYEIGDVRNTRPFSSPLAFALFLAERFVLTLSDVLVLTSAGFLHHPALPFRAFREKAVIIENKLPSRMIITYPRPAYRMCLKENDRISIGFVGLLRYPRTFLPMLDFVAENSSKFVLHVYGDGPLRQIVEQCSAERENIHYHGPFSYPDDLEKIYKSIDVSWVVYDNTDLNVRLALPNKLYESIYFGVPLVVSNNTYLSEIVTQKQLGFVAKTEINGFIEKAFEDLTFKNISLYSNNLLDQPVETCVENLDGIAASIDSSMCLSNMIKPSV